MNKTVDHTVLSHVWTEISKQLHKSFRQKNSRKNHNFFLSANFEFSIPSQGGHLKMNKTAYRTVLSLLWTKIFPKIGYVSEKTKQNPHLWTEIFQTFHIYFGRKLREN